MSSIGLSFGESLADERPRSLTSAVQERLRADILSTRLLPGQKLHIAGLAKQFSVSLAAVREALSRLVADGLVQASDQRGFRVSPVSPADLADVTQTRIDIEGLALRRSIERGDAAWLASVEKSSRRSVPFPTPIPTIRPHHYEEWVVRHRIFHRTLVNACGSQWLLGFRDVLHEQSERYRRLSIRRDTEKIPQRRGRTRGDRACRAQARCRCRGRGTLEAFHDDHASRRARHTRKRSEVATPPDRPFEDQTNQEKTKGNVTMKITRRHILATITAATLLGASAIAQAADTVRIGLADQDLLADHDRRDGGAPETVREGRHQGRADDLSQRRRDVRGDGGGRRRRHPRRHLAGVGRTQEGRELQGASPTPPWAITAGS